MEESSHATCAENLVLENKKRKKHNEETCSKKRASNLSEQQLTLDTRQHLITKKDFAQNTNRCEHDDPDLYIEIDESIDATTCTEKLLLQKKKRKEYDRKRYAQKKASNLKEQQVRACTEQDLLIQTNLTESSHRSEHVDRELYMNIEEGQIARGPPSHERHKSLGKRKYVSRASKTGATIHKRKTTDLILDLQSSETQISRGYLHGNYTNIPTVHGSLPVLILETFRSSMSRLSNYKIF